MSIVSRSFLLSEIPSIQLQIQGLVSSAERLAPSSLPQPVGKLFKEGILEIQRRLNISNPPLSFLSPVSNKLCLLSPSGSGPRCWRLRGWHPGPRQRRKSLATHSASGSPEKQVKDKVPINERKRRQQANSQKWLAGVFFPIGSSWWNEFPLPPLIVY